MISLSGIYLKIAYFPVKIGLIGGVGGPRIFLLLESSYLCYLGAHVKIQNPTTPPYAVLATVVGAGRLYSGAGWLYSGAGWLYSGAGRLYSGAGRF